jgi:hypothetical protein
MVQRLAGSKMQKGQRRRTSDPSRRPLNAEGTIELRDEHSGTFGPHQDTSHNIVKFPQRRPSKAEALMAYAHAKTDAERYRAMNALVLARLAERGRQ